MNITTEPPADYTPATLDCPEWTVPGWLDEHGNPTSCVSNHPCPGLEAPACEPETPEPAPVPETPVDAPSTVQPVTPAPVEELAYTGIESVTWAVLLVAVVLVAVGLWLKRIGEKA